MKIFIYFAVNIGIKLLGGWDGLLIALFTFVVFNCITEIMCIILKKKRFKKIGLGEFFKKLLIFILVSMANVLDVYVICTGHLARNFIIIYYISLEGISLLKNANSIGMPIPNHFKSFLEHLGDKD